MTYFVLGLFMGPAVAIAYGITQFNSGFVITTLSLMYLVSIPVMYAILQKLNTQHRFKNKLLEKFAENMDKKKEELAEWLDEIAEHFKKRLGDVGFYFGLATFSFIVGLYWATLVAFFIRVDTKRAIISVGSGSVLAVIFWWYVIIKSISFITPLQFALLFLVLTLLLFAYSEIKQRATIKSMASFVRNKIEKVTKETEKSKKEILKGINT